MAKAKKKTTTVITSDEVIPDGSADIPADDPTELDTLDEWDVLDDAEGKRFQVHKLPSRAGEREAYCYTYSGADLSLDTIRETFGGGTYRITARNAQNQYQGSKRVSIIELPKPLQPPAREGEFLQRGERSSNEAMTMIMKVMEEQGKLLAALLTRPPVPPQTGPTALELVQLIKAMERKESDPVGMLLKGLEMGKSLGGGGETSMLDVAAQGLSALAPLIAQQAGKAPPRPAPPPKQLPPETASPAAAPAPNAEGPPKETGEDVEILKKLQWLKLQTVQLVNLAARGKREDGEFVKDPELYAEVFMDNLPPFITIDEIVERLSGENVIAQLAQINPAVAQHAQWFEQFRQGCLDSVEAEDEDEGNPPGEMEP